MSAKKTDRYTDIILKVMIRQKYPMSMREIAKLCYMSPITVKKKLEILLDNGDVASVEFGNGVFWMTAKYYTETLDILEKQINAAEKDDN